MATRTLRAALAAGRLPPTEAVRIAVQLCDALVRGGQVGRDVRPEAVRVDSVSVRVTADAVEGDRGPYLAPECRRGWSAGDARSDVYAVGVVLYEMLAGRLPVDRFPWPGQFEPGARWLDPIVLKCLADDPARRFGSLGEVRAELLRGPPTRLRWPYALAGMVALGVLAVCGAARLGMLALPLIYGWAPVPPAGVPSPDAAPPPPPIAFLPPPSLAPEPPPDPAAIDAMDRKMAEQTAARARAAQAARTVVLGAPPVPGDTAQIGGHGGGPFRTVGTGDRPMLGLTYTVGSWGGNGCLRRVDPIYGGGDDVYTVGPNGGTIAARPGYAVGGLLVQADDTNVVAVAVVFMAWRHGHLVPADQYTSGWVGYPFDRNPAFRLDGGGRTVLGLVGHRGMNLDAVGLVVGLR